MSYFVRTSKMKWGYDSIDLIKALRNADVEQMTLATVQVEFLEQAIGDDDYSISEALKDANEQYAFEKKEARKFPENYTVTIDVISPKGYDWEFEGVSPVDGAPSYKWTGDEEMPPLELEYERFNFNTMTGEFTPE